MTRFTPCRPDSQKCVSSLNDSGYPAMEPIAFSGTADEAFAAIRQVVAAQPRTTVEEEADDRYLRAIFRTKLLRFADEVELEVDDDARVVHFKSRSTLKWARDDLNANRDRMDHLGDQLRAQLDP